MIRRKKLICLLMALSLLTAACGSSMDTNKTPGVDVDLSVLSGTVVYGKVYDMITNGAQYQDQIVRMEGMMSTIPVMQRGKQVDLLYSCVISDATKCCSQGIEFVLKEGTSYPDIGDTIVVEGRWDNYKLYGLDRYRLLDAVLKSVKK